MQKVLAYFIKGIAPFALFAIPFFVSAGTITITSPLGSASTTAGTSTPSVTVGQTLTISFTAVMLNEPFAGIQLLKNGAAQMQIASVPYTRRQTDYTTRWLVPQLAAGNYTISVTEGLAGTSAVRAEVPITVIAQTQNTLVNINPDDVIFDATTGTYRFKKRTTETQILEQQLYELGGSQGEQGDANAVVGVIGDALVNASGQCVGQLLANSVVSAVSSLSGAVDPTTAMYIATHQPKQDSKNVGTLTKPSWDSIGYCIGNAMIESLAYSITDWINNDFELPDGSRGSSFLSNPEQFFTNLADRTAGEFIGSFDIAGINLCSPFSLSIKLDLLKQYRRDYRQRATCTLSQVVQNMDNFVNQGDFRQGGWAGWLSLTQSPSNNYYGSYILASDELGARIVSARNRVTLDLSNGKGFLSFRKCEEWQTVNVSASDSSGNSVTRPTKKSCKKWSPVKTPGSLIEEQANRSLGNTENRLVFANSFDQVVTALVNTLMKKVLQGFSNN